MMRVGIEKTNETSESLLENEEKWLNKQLPASHSKLAGLSMDELRHLPTVLSQRNDLVLPRYHYLPVTFEREGTWKEFAKGTLRGLILSVFLIPFYLLWSVKRSQSGKD
jgi:hypothetical protein